MFQCVVITRRLYMKYIRVFYMYIKTSLGNYGYNIGNTIV